MTTTPDAHPVVPWLTPHRRAWLYRLVVAAMPLLVLYGVAAEQDVAVWIGVAAAFLGSGTAALHTPTADTVDIDDRLQGHAGQSQAVTVLVVVFLAIVILKLIGAI